MKRSFTLRAAIVGLSSFVLVSTSSANPDASLQSATADDGPVYSVDGLQLGYQNPLSFLPDIADQVQPAASQVEVELAVTETGYVAPRQGLETITVAFGDLSTGGRFDLHRSGLDVMVQTLKEGLAADRRVGLDFFVAADPADISPQTGQDLRRRRTGPLRLLLAFDGPFYPVSRFNLGYVDADPTGFPPVDELMAGVQANLVATQEGYVAWRPGIEPTPVVLGDLDGSSEVGFSAGAIQVTLEAIRDYLTSHGYMTVHVRPAETELDPQGLADKREGGRTDFRVIVVTGKVGELRTLAVGDRIPVNDRINHPKHSWILEKSPIHPVGPGEEGTSDVLQRSVLDEYLFRISRHPGRRVDAAIAPAEQSGKVALDFIVNENRPLTIYSQASNTGTEQTERMRYRFGLFHNQVTGRDDTFSAEYITADFDANNTVVGSYDAKFFNSDYLRWRAYGAWSEFSASEVGFSDEEFTGESYTFGAELAWNFYQNQQLFIDLVGGARYLNIEVNNAFVFVFGEQDFLLPYIGFRGQRYTEAASTDFSVMLEANLPDAVSVDEAELNRLGRLSPDEDWFTLRWDASHSFYLEPLLYPEAWHGRADSNVSTLAHEIALRCRGQYAFDYRLIPQMEQVAGGMYSVRGYPESVAVGDTVIIGTAEYRLHVPRAFGYSEDPSSLGGQPFRVIPQHPFGKADWDLILRGFIDFAQTYNSEPFSFEDDQTLLGAGCGIQIQFKRNLDLRVDWGFALDDLEGQVESGSNRVHFVGTILF